MTVDLATVVQATGAQVLHLAPDGLLRENELRVADLQRSFVDVAIDSRAVSTGGLFVALRGERTDGHHHLDAALERGAHGCLVADSLGTDVIAGHLRSTAERDRIWIPRYFLAVPDTLRALHRLATCLRDRHAADVVGITGSVGKTTTKEVIAGLLGSHWPVLKSAGNFNTEIGLPLMLLQLAAEHRVAVLEMGMYAAGDINLLAEIARPRIGVVTNVAPVHLERMGTIERIARAKSELIAALPGDGLAVLNGDDPWTRAMARTTGIARSVLVGLAEDCDYRATDVVTHALDGVSFTVLAEGRATPLRTRIPGGHLVHAFLAASATARALGMEWDAIQEAAANVRLEGRQQLLPVREDLLIIDDSYNASPLSMQAALDLLAATPGRKIAVLGDMLELGPGEEAAHREVGGQAARIVDWLVVRGSRGIWIAEEAGRRGLSAERVVRAASNDEAAQLVIDIIASPPGTSPPAQQPTIRQPHDGAPQWTVLVKGSRGMGLEEVVTKLRGER
jgi:UDP-N-acetylmuramoyl-tripeptide--D-alanyl-D-alanine ligase